jgi:ribulose-phosphate 3-epimerase
MIAPSILSADFSRLGEEIKMVEKAGADLLHIDVMDGIFVPQLTIGTPVVKSIRKISKLLFDVHLMVKHPDILIEQFAEAGADMISFHMEATPTPFRTITNIKKLGKKAGIAINPLTPVSIIEDAINYVDYVLVMSVSPGFGGQKFIPSTFDKIIRIDNLRKERKLNFLIEIDGGINDTKIISLKKAGVDIFVAGSYIFKADNPVQKLKKIKELLKWEKRE